MRRRNSRQMTRKAAPMQDAANIALFFMCQLEVRKQESTTFQFHSISILHVLLFIFIPPAIECDMAKAV